MAETIESFVAKLQAQGVDAGKKKAKQLQEEANQNAEKIVADAQAQAEKIIADAKAQAENDLARGRTELQLAARDTALRLRETLTAALNAVLSSKTRQELSDGDFLKQVLVEIVRVYAQNDAAGESIEVNLTPEMKQNLSDWATKELSNVDLEGELSQAGFEYTATGATVEVTVDSVVESLSALVSPKLRSILEEAMAKEGE
jgi:V/A-type H+-transporting ATPase subunit E